MYWYYSDILWYSNIQWNDINVIIMCVCVNEDNVCVWNVHSNINAIFYYSMCVYYY